jgi:hypothetical protein
MTAPRNIYGIAREMARPVARGDLPLVQADAAIICDTLQQERSGALQGLKAPDVVRLKRFLLRGFVEREQVRRDLAEHRIRRLLAPMIAARKPPNALLAEAHGVNGAAGFPLTEEEVTDVVRGEVFFSLPPAPGGRRHAG